MLFNKIRISIYFIFFLVLFISVAYNKYQYNQIQLYKSELNTLKTTLINIKQINDKNMILDKKYNNILNSINKGGSDEPEDIIKNFNNISDSMYKLYDTRLYSN